MRIARPQTEICKCHSVRTVCELKLSSSSGGHADDNDDDYDNNGDSSSSEDDNGGNGNGGRIKMGKIAMN